MIGALGLKQQLFGVSSYSIMVGLGILTGVIYYIVESRKNGYKNEKSLYIILFALVGGSIGAKIPAWIHYFPQIIENPSILELWLTGRTILGGFIGGLLSVKVCKKIFNIKLRMGNYIAPSVALGMSVGRIGCLLGGCCFGKPTDFIISMDLGDEIMRHPTQIYEILFHFTAFLMLRKADKDKFPKGALFKIYLCAYFIFRFIMEYLRAEPIVLAGLTAYQLVSVLGFTYCTITIICMGGFNYDGRE